MKKSNKLKQGQFGMTPDGQYIIYYYISVTYIIIAIKRHLFEPFEMEEGQII